MPRACSVGYFPLFACLLVAGPLHAAKPVGAQFLSQPLSVRQMGMGDVSFGGADVMRSWSNPALLGLQDKKWELAVNGASEMADGVRTAGFGIGYRLSPGVCMGLVADGRDFSASELDVLGNETGGDMVRRSGVGGIVTTLRLGNLSAGVTAKGAYDVVDHDRAGGLIFDSGLIFSWLGVEAGVALRNWGQPLRTGEALPLEFSAGAASGLMIKGMTAGLEYSMVRGMKGRIGLGVDYWPARFFGIRTGMSGIRDGDRQLTCGFSSVVGRLGLDYALAAGDLGPSHRASVSYSFNPRPVVQAAVAVQPVMASAGESSTISASATRVVESSEVVIEKSPVKLNVAVANLDSKKDLADDAAMISDMLRVAMVRTGRFSVVEKKYMELILSEQIFQQAGCTTEQCAVKLGKLLNVQRVIVGSFGKLTDQYFINMWVVNVETGQVILADYKKLKKLKNIEVDMAELAVYIADRIE